MMQLPGLQHRRRERRLVDGVRKVLGLQTKSRTKSIRSAVLADESALQIVPRIELQTRLGRPQVHRAPALWIAHRRRALELPTAAGQHEVVIVPVRDLQLPLPTAYALADGLGLEEIERAA